MKTTFPIWAIIRVRSFLCVCLSENEIVSDVLRSYLFSAYSLTILISISVAESMPSAVICSNGP